MEVQVGQVNLRGSFPHLASYVLESIYNVAPYNVVNICSFSMFQIACTAIHMSG